jgi:hypothetical protein
VKQWDKTIFTDGHDEGTFVVTGAERCYTVANRSSAQVNGYKTQPNRDATPQPLTTYDYWIIQFCDTTLSTAVEQNALEESFSVFPNPAAEVLNVRLSEKEKHTLEIRNVLGETVYTIVTDEQFISLPVESLAKGMYSVTVSSASAMQTKKFLKE